VQCPASPKNVILVTMRKAATFNIGDYRVAVTELTLFKTLRGSAYGLTGASDDRGG
jgi:hypothetical protein